jgi:hypothetical protein
MLKRWRERHRERERTFFGSFASCMRKKQAHKVSDTDAGHLVAADFFKFFFCSRKCKSRFVVIFLWYIKNSRAFLVSIML